MYTTKLTGLNVQSNSFSSARIGGLEVAHNLTLSRDYIYTKRNGYFASYSAPELTPLALADYKNSLVQISTDSLHLLTVDQDGYVSSDTSLLGLSFNISKGRSVQAGGNLYIPTDSYTLKLEDTSSFLLKAGVPKAPDLTYLALGSGSVQSPMAGIHAPDSQIGYRVVFGRTDANDLEVLGAPSEFAVATNDLFASSSVSLASYVVTVNTSSAHNLVANEFVTIRNSNGTVQVPDGEYVVSSAPSLTQFKFSTAAVLATPPSGVTSLNFGIRIKPKLDFTIPQGLNSTYFYRIYRTSPSLSNDVEADESTLQQVYQLNLTAADISAGYVQYTDTVDDLFKNGYLYTNPNTGEGINSANFPPPTATDIAFFKEHVFMSNVKTDYTLELDLINSSAAGWEGGDYLDVIQQNNPTPTTSATWISGFTVRYAMTPPDGLTVGQYVNFTNFTNIRNNFTVVVTAIATDYIECTNFYIFDGSNNETNSVAVMRQVRRYTATTDGGVTYNTTEGGVFDLELLSSSVAKNIDTTARSIVKVINRDSKSNIYASYTSSSQSLPGQMFMYGRESNDYAAFQEYSRGLINFEISNFDPTLPSAQTYSTSSDFSVVMKSKNLTNAIFVSKQGEFEAFPLLRYRLVGSKSAAIQRIIPLKNSLIILKEDGIFSLRGTTFNDFIIVPLDTSITCNAIETVQVLNGAVYALTLDGVVRISETEASVVSRDIEPLLTSIFSLSSFSENTFSTSIDDLRLYLLTTVSPSSGDPITYCYNYLTEQWTTWDILFKGGVVLTQDRTHYGIGIDNKIIRMRRKNDKLDFCDESTSILELSNLATNKKSIDIVSNLSISAGDIFVWDGAINRVSSVAGNTVYFTGEINFDTDDTPVHYKGIRTMIATAPYSSSENVLYQWQEMVLSFRNQTCSELQLGFISDANETDLATWQSEAWEGGWGELGWGVFEWGGVTESSTIDVRTYAAQPVRIFIPLECQISTWLKLKLEHYQAGEAIQLQGIGYEVRKISNRVSR